MKEKLCSSCQENETSCMFKVYGNLINDSIPKIPTVKDIDKLSKLIEIHREEAQINNCPNTNSFRIFEISLFVKRYLGLINQNRHVTIKPPESKMSELINRIKTELELKIEQQKHTSNR